MCRAWNVTHVNGWGTPNILTPSYGPLSLTPCTTHIPDIQRATRMAKKFVFYYGFSDVGGAGITTWANQPYSSDFLIGQQRARKVRRHRGGKVGKRAGRVERVGRQVVVRGGRPLRHGSPGAVHS